MYNLKVILEDVEFVKLYRSLSSKKYHAEVTYIKDDKVHGYCASDKSLARLILLINKFLWKYR